MNLANLSPKIINKSLLTVTILVNIGIVQAQNFGKEDSTFKPTGKLWGLVYGDFAFKAQSDELNRGGLNQ